ncbi:MAG: hypothetical protein GXX82_14460 [Syntrophorhabdus sp.]|nr:hypothetical protein [Syntrophorhabdus sp.]
MKKALVFFFAVVIGICFASTGFAQETSGPAKQPKKLPKGRYVKTKKTQQTGTASAAQQPAQAATPATPAKPATPATHVTSSSSTAPTKVQDGTVGPGSTEGKKLAKGKYTKQKKSTGGGPAGQ